MRWACSDSQPRPRRPARLVLVLPLSPIVVGLCWALPWHGLRTFDVVYWWLFGVLLLWLKCSGVRLELQQRMERGTSFGECVATIEERLGQGLQ